MGSGPHGSYDLRSFQRVVLERRLFPGKSLLTRIRCCRFVRPRGWQWQPQVWSAGARAVGSMPWRVRCWRLALGERMGAAPPELIVV